MPTLNMTFGIVMARESGALHSIVSSDKSNGMFSMNLWLMSSVCRSYDMISITELGMRDGIHGTNG